MTVEERNNDRVRRQLFRLKQVQRLQDTEENTDDSELKKVLGTRDLISLGVGSCVGTGMYLVTGMVAKTMAGPAVVISYMIAGIAAMLSGLCYAELGVRVPHTTGSAYIYSYVTVGEIIAFVIGWNMILEYIIGTAACACALSACLDILSSSAITNATEHITGNVWDTPPDILACFITLTMMLIFINGVKKSIMFNNVLCGLNLIAWIVVVFVGLFFIRSSNWDPFAPFGVGGIFKGAATCFYAFIGFDIIATTGEEAKDPKRSIPKAITHSLLIVMVAYMSCTIIMTLMVPYTQLNDKAALVHVWGQVGYPFIQWIISLGALAALTASMFGSMFPMPRIAYAMAKDGLIFKFLGEVNDKGVPACANLCLGLISALCALILPFQVLVEMMSIGTLLAYTLVDGCVLILRYQPSKQQECPAFIEILRIPSEESENKSISTEEERSLSEDRPQLESEKPKVRSIVHIIRDFIIWKKSPVEEYEEISIESGRIVLKLCFVALIFILALEILVAFINFSQVDLDRSIFIVFILLIFVFIITTILNIISKFPQERPMGFLTPGVPWIPTLGIIINIFLMFRLSTLTLVRFTIWMFLGFAIYFKYSIHESALAKKYPPV